jgi:WD40 repeat protein
VQEGTETQLLLGDFKGVLTTVSPPDNRLQTIARLPAAATAFVQHGRMLFVADESGALHWFEGNRPCAQWDGVSKAVLSLDYQPETQRLLAVGADGIIRLWSLRPPRLFKATIGHRRGVLLGAFLNASTVLTLGDDQQTLLWNIDDFETPQERLPFPTPTQQCASHRDEKGTLFIVTHDGVYQYSARRPSWKRLLALPFTPFTKEDN